MDWKGPTVLCRRTTVLEKGTKKPFTPDPEHYVLLTWSWTQHRQLLAFNA